MWEILEKTARENGLIVGFALVVAGFATLALYRVGAPFWFFLPGLVLVGGGARRTFTSTPELLSWNPFDWDPAYTRFAFGSPWSLRFPAWVSDCGGIELNGSWTTTMRIGLPGYFAGCANASTEKTTAAIPAIKRIPVCMRISSTIV